MLRLPAPKPTVAGGPLAVCEIVKNCPPISDLPADEIYPDDDSCDEA